MSAPIEPLGPVEYALRREAWIAEGRLKAFHFAMDCHGNIDCIENEIQDRESTIAELLAANPRGPMAPGASPRIHMDAYLASLREAIELIRRLQLKNG